MRHVILAPHADDEIIGCFEVLQNIKRRDIVILYGTPEAHKEANRLNSICYQFPYPDFFIVQKIERDDHLYFPDPYFELHPSHRYWGAVGENLLRKGFKVTFYVTNMLAPYIFECPNPEKKRDWLEYYYPDKSSLWKYDHKYFLFEGYNKWLLNSISDE
jgi:hypothetical protein